VGGCGNLCRRTSLCSVLNLGMLQAMGDLAATPLGPAPAQSRRCRPLRLRWASAPDTPIRSEARDPTSPTAALPGSWLAGAVYLAAGREVPGTGTDTSSRWQQIERWYLHSIGSTLNDVACQSTAATHPLLVALLTSEASHICPYQHDRPSCSSESLSQRQCRHVVGS